MKKNETKVTILTLVNYARDYPWASYIANSLSQFDSILPELMQSKAKEISIYLNTDDCLMEFSSEIPDPEEIEPDFTFKHRVYKLSGILRLIP